jgi:undecaprenyl pyrophosphate phosphatase UppP
MKNTLIQKLALYLYNNFLGNFLGFMIGMASTGLVSHYFATKSIKNLWGLTTRKTLVDKQTFNMMEWALSILIGFIVFEIVSKTVKKKMDEWIPSWKKALKSFMEKTSLLAPSNNTVAYAEKDAAASGSRSARVYRDVQ